MCGYKKYCMLVVDPKWYNMGCHGNLKYIFVGGGLKRKIAWVAGLIKKCLPRGRHTYFWSYIIEFSSRNSHADSFSS